MNENVKNQNKKPLAVILQRGVIFQRGNPVPKVWLHMEFDLQDTMKYIGGILIETDEEANRLTEKYLS